MATWRMLILIAIGIVGLPLGSQMLIDGGQTFAQMTNSSEILVGITLLAVGSSLPELGAGIAAAMRKQSDVALGNILGSSIFNILGAGGVVALTGAQKLSPEFHNYSHWAMGLSALMIAAVIYLKRRIGIVTALVFLLFYAVYIFGLVRGANVSELQCIFVKCDTALPARTTPRPPGDIWTAAWHPAQCSGAQGVPPVRAALDCAPPP
jgi:cation:H+ antiporter